MSVPEEQQTAPYQTQPQELLDFLDQRGVPPERRNYLALLLWLFRQVRQNGQDIAAIKQKLGL
jgi:hypothetical protein